MQLDPAKVARDFVFVAGQIDGPDAFTFVAHERALLEKKRYRAHLLRLDARIWTSLAKFDWQVVDVVANAGELRGAFVLGRDGQIATLDGAGLREEKLHPSKALGPLRGLSAAAGTLFAHGMKREVFRRETRGVWAPFDAGMTAAAPVAKGKVDVSAMIKQGIKDLGGIDAIVEAEPGELIAVGWRGEIWSNAGSAWRRIDSPTNLALHDAVVRADGFVWACGQAGTLVKGRKGAWSPVTVEEPRKLDFRAICELRGEIYVADGHSLRVLRDNRLEVVEFTPGEIVPSVYLNTSHGHLLSIAGQELFVTSDGLQWRALLV